LVGVEEELARLGSDGESSRDRALGLGELARELLCLRKENEECRRAGLVPRLGRECVATPRERAASVICFAISLVSRTSRSLVVAPPMSVRRIWPRSQPARTKGALLV